MGSRAQSPAARAKARAKKRTVEEYLDRLDAIIDSNEPAAVRVAAIDHVLDRIAGKPKQSMDVFEDIRAVGYANVPPVAKTMEEWERIAKTPPPKDS